MVCRKNKQDACAATLSQKKSCRRGFTLIEVITVTVIIAVLAVIAIPLAHNAFQREKEIDLRRGLRLLRSAIDDYKKLNLRKTPTAIPKNWTT
jgi:general secretion pathway protein G